MTETQTAFDFTAAPAPELSWEETVLAFARDSENVYSGPGGDVDFYCYEGRRWTRVFWVRKGSSERFGSVSFFVETTTGDVYTAKGAKKVGHRTGLNVRGLLREALKSES